MKTARRRNEGSVSYTLLIMVLFLSVLMMTVYSVMGVSFVLEEKFDEEREAGKELKALEPEIMSLFFHDDDPEADSLFDPLWTEPVPGLGGDMTMEIRELSSRINLNYIDPVFLHETNFRDNLTVLSTPQVWAEYREKIGLTGDFEDFSDLLGGEDWVELCSPYSYANVNLTDPEALKRLCEARTGNTQPADELIQARAAEPVEKGDLESLLGEDYDKLVPLLGTEALLNVNIADESLIAFSVWYALRDFPEYNWLSKKEEIISRRESDEINGEELKQLLDVPEKGEIVFQYLGVRSWFWEINLKNDEYLYRFITARLPGPEEGTDRYQVISRTLERNVD